MIEKLSTLLSLVISTIDCTSTSSKLCEAIVPSAAIAFPLKVSIFRSKEAMAAKLIFTRYMRCISSTSVYQHLPMPVSLEILSSNTENHLKAHAVGARSIYNQTALKLHV